MLGAVNDNFSPKSYARDLHANLAISNVRCLSTALHSISFLSPRQILGRWWSKVGRWWSKVLHKKEFSLIGLIFNNHSLHTIYVSMAMTYQYHQTKNWLTMR